MCDFKKFNRIIAWLLVVLLLLPVIPSRNIKAESMKNELDERVDNIISKKPEVYDVLVKCSPVGLSTEGMSRKDIAKLSQEELIRLLENYKENGKVESYKSFYVVNGVHIRTKDKTVLREIIRLKNVIDITENGKVKLVEPIKDEEKYRSVIFVPDESRIDWGVSMVHADKVWKDFGIEGEGVTVGIIDTGVNYNLPAIKKGFKGYNESTGMIEPGYYKDFIDGLTEPEQGSINDHGTHVAGTIVGKEGDKLNVIGVAPKAKYISARAIDNNGGEVSNLLAAGEWMLEMKPDIINNSWGGTNDADKWFSEMAQAWREAGIVPVFAAGNQMAGEDAPGYGSISNPGNLLNVFSVGAVDINKNLGSFSKKGPSAHDATGKIIKPDVVAPGVQVRSVDGKGKYVSWNGTSMATPHVVGVMALMKSANPNLSVDDIERIIRETAEPIKESIHGTTPNMSYGYGLIDAYDAVASIYDRGRGSISGFITRDGSDQGPAVAKFLNDNEHYNGRNLTLSMEIKDDISVREVVVFYRMVGEEDWKEIQLELDKGSVSDGTYKAVVDAKNFSAGILELKASVLDYSGQETLIDKRIEIKGGVSPVWHFDFDAPMSGFILEGNWKISKGKANGEPAMSDGKEGNYIGINGGTGTFAKRVESRMYLPPVDVTKLEKGSNLSLSYHEYKGFTGISIARLEASLDGKKWDLVHNVVQRPDIAERVWEYNTYDLSKYAGEGSPLLLRMYFLGHDADEGCGWYIDNLHLDTGDKIAPGQVTNLKSEINQQGLFIKFKMNEETDIKDYVLERKVDDGDFLQIATLNNDKADFINDGKNPTHFIVTYKDEDVEVGKTYSYRVAARDVYGNQSEWSKEINVFNKSYEWLLLYDFEDGEQGFTSATLSGSVNDWEIGKPTKPNKELTFIEREIWSGMEKNPTKVWGTKVDGAYSRNQDSYLMMPMFHVPKEGDFYFYLDSYSTVSSVDLDSFVVEIRKNNENQWYTLFSKEEIQNGKTQHMWQTLRKSLEAYRGEDVWVRFHATTGNGVVFDYSLGWYIDNICVGPWREVYTDNLGKNEGADNSGNGSLSTEENTVISPFRSVMTPDEIKAVKVGMEYENESVENEPVIVRPTNGSLAPDFPKNSPKEGIGIPLVAKIEVLETGKYAYSSDIDGSYKIEQALNLENKPYTIRISAYGYETVTSQVDLSKEPHQDLSIKMKAAKQTNLKLKVVDEEGNPIERVKARIVELESILPWESSSVGEVESDFVFTGKYTLRLYKEGYVSKEISIDLEEGVNTLGKIVLERNKASQNHQFDYGFVIEETEGSYQTIHFVGSMKGSAVAFQSPYRGGILKNASLFLVNNKYYGGSHIQVAVLGYDEEGRLRELAPFREIKDVVLNEWNTVDFTEFNIQRDKPIFIATRYEKNLEESAGLYYDLKASEEAKAKSFVYDGAFTATNALPAHGGFAIKTEWMYMPDALENPQDPIQENGSNPDVGFIVPEQEGAFIFDEDTGTITGYTGTKTNLIIPKEINGIAVKHIGERAFDNTGKAIEVKLRKLVIPEGVETIGKDAFINNNLGEIKLPSTLNKIGESAFKGQWKSGIEDKSLKVNIPPQVKILEKSTFEDAGAPINVTGGEGLLEVKQYAFQGSKEVTLEAPVLQKIEDRAFGYSKSASFTYALIYTNINTKLKSKDGEYLINPALVTLNMVDARDHENILKIGLKYGPKNPKSIKRDMDPDIFYKIGDTVSVGPYDFIHEGQTYTSTDAPVNMTLKKDNPLTFYVYPRLPRFRMPILKEDKEVVGFAIPNAKIELEIGGRVYETTTNEDGYFVIKVEKGILGEQLAVKVNNKSAGNVAIETWQGEKFIIRNKKLLRYMGSDENITLPVGADGEKAMTEVGELAFWGKSLKKVVLADKLQTIKSGAFMGTGLESFAWNLEDINRASLRTIEEYAFKDNAIKQVILPELTHAIGPKAFENNRIEVLELGKYTGHIGKEAFKNNKLTSLYLPGALEEIGKGAFRSNLLEKIDLETKRTVRDEMNGLSVLPDYVFADNKLKEITLPDYIKKVEESAFVGNGNEHVKVYTDVAGVVEGIWHDVVRSDGQILKRKDEKNNEEDPNNKPQEEKPNGNSPNSQKEQPGGASSQAQGEVSDNIEKRGRESLSTNLQEGGDVSLEYQSFVTNKSASASSILLNKKEDSLKNKNGLLEKTDSTQAEEEKTEDLGTFSGSDEDALQAQDKEKSSGLGKLSIFVAILIVGIGIVIFSLLPIGRKKFE